MKKKGNIHRSAEDWRTIIQAFDNSELTQDEFCKKHHLASSTFHKWKKHFRESTSSDSPDFIEVLPASHPRQPVTHEPGFTLSITFTHRFHLHLKIL